MLLRSPGLGLGAGRRLLKGGAEATLWLFLRAFVEVAIHERVFKGFTLHFTGEFLGMEK